MATRRAVSNPLALAVLASLRERPMHPYEISTTLRHRGKHESININYGSLYNVVDQLVRRGLITPKETTREGKRPERTVYRITPAGRTELEDWMAELLGTPAREFSAFEAGLSLAAVLPPDEVADLLDERTKQLRIELKQWEALKDTIPGLPRLFWIEGEYRFALRQAELEYVSRLRDDIRSGALEGVDVWRQLHETQTEDGGLPQIDYSFD